MPDPDLFGRHPNGAFVGMQQATNTDAAGRTDIGMQQAVRETPAQAAKRHFDSLFLILSIERDKAMRTQDGLTARACAITVTELETAQLWCNHIFADSR